MNIYIYGSKSFKKDVHNELDHSNIKFRLDEASSIVELGSLDELKRTIETCPNDIFLIDDDKIIKKEGLHQKFKFLIPKDGIEESYLFEHGVGDISFDSIEELSNHVINKIEDDNDEDNFAERNEIQESIADIVQDAYEESDNHQEEANDRIALDDELSMLLSANIPVLDEDERLEPSDDLNAQLKNFDPNEDEDFEDDPVFDFDEELKGLDLEVPLKEELPEKSDNIEDELKHLEISEASLDDELNNDDAVTTDDEELNSLASLDMLSQLKDLEISDNDFDEKEEVPRVNTVEDIDNINFDALDSLEITNEDFMSEDERKNQIQESHQQSANVQDIQGDYEMAENFSSLDDIKESDIIAALNGEEVSISDTQVLTSATAPAQKESINLDLANAGDISALLTQLLKNKTLEITVKVKE